MLRTLFKSDIKQLLLIEQSVHVIPWGEETFNICFQSGCLGWGIEIDKKIIGFILVSLQAEECHILNLAIAMPYQRQGYGRQLLNHVLAHATQKGAGIIYLEVRSSNTRAISLYRKMKFHFIAERKGYYPMPNGQEDALVFAKSLKSEEN